MRGGPRSYTGGVLSSSRRVVGCPHLRAGCFFYIFLGGISLSVVASQSKNSVSSSLYERFFCLSWVCRFSAVGLSTVPIFLPSICGSAALSSSFFSIFCPVEYPRPMLSLFWSIASACNMACCVVGLTKYKYVLLFLPLPFIPYLGWRGCFFYIFLYGSSLDVFDFVWV